VDETKSARKPFDIPKTLIWKAYLKVKDNRGAAGMDGQTLAEFEQGLQNNLFKLWNRMSSGSYFPAPVKAVSIPKSGGGARVLGVPTIADRIAQTAVAMVLEPKVDPVFHNDSYGYRLGKSALDAVEVCKQRCWRRPWVVDLDIQGFFDNVPHAEIVAAVQKHTDLPWVVLYVKRWLVAPIQHRDDRCVVPGRERRRVPPSHLCCRISSCATRWIPGLPGIFRWCGSRGTAMIWCCTVLVNDRRDSFVASSRSGC
jgi:RNA-directed DNA polymerase